MRNFTLSAVSGLLGLFLSLLSLESFSATRTATATGNWSAAATWGGAGNFPVAGDIVKINKGVTLTCDTTMTIASIACANAGTGTSSAFVVNVGKTLTVNGIVDLAPYGTSNTSSLTVNGTLICTGGLQSMEVYGGGLGLTLLTGSFTSITVASTGTLNIGSGFGTDQALGFSVTNNGIITGTTLAFTQALAKTISGSGSFNFTGGAVSLTQSTVTGTLTFTGSTLTLSGTSLTCNTATFTGAVSMTSTSTLAVASSITGTTFSATGGFINGAGTHTFTGAVTVQTSANCSSNISTISGDLTITSSTVSGTITASTSGNITISGTTALSSTVSTASGTVTMTGTITGTGKVVGTGTGTLAGTITASKISCGTLSFSTSTKPTLTIDSVYCSSLTCTGANGGVGATATLTYFNVTGNVSINNADPFSDYIFSIKNLIVGGNLSIVCGSQQDYSNQWTIRGTSTVGGDLTLGYTASFSTFGVPVNQFSIGTSTETGSLTVTGNFSMSSAMTGSYATDSVNVVYLKNGTFTVDSVKSTLTTAANIGNNMIMAHDNYNFDGLTKSLVLKGSVSGAGASVLKVGDSNSNINFTTYFSGSGKQQTIPTHDNWNFKKIEISNTTDSVLIGGTLSAAGSRITGKFKINSGAKFTNAGYKLFSTASTTDSLEIANGGTLFLRNMNDSLVFPVQMDYISNSAGGTIYFLNSSSTADSILKVPSSTVGKSFAKSLGNVTVGGTGTKQIVQPLSSSATNGLSIENLTVASGTLTFLSTSTHFDLVAGAQSTTQTVTVSSGATLQIPRNFTVTSNSPAAKFTFDTLSTLEYSNTADQAIYRMHSTTAGSGNLATLGNLTLSGTGNKSIADSVKVARKVTIGGTSAVLALSASASLTLTSTSTTQTGYIGTISSGAATPITYATGAKIYCQRYVYLPDTGYRDFSSPIKSTTLSTWKDGGILFAGFTGSDYPTFYYNNAYTYDETQTGDLETGWNPADNITNATRTWSGLANASKIVRGGWRIYSGQVGGLSFTLNDNGEVFTGPIDFRANFTRTAGTDANSIANDGWNFFGNPYPCAVNLQLLYNNNLSLFMTDSLTAGGFSPTVYSWMPSDRGNPAGTLKYGSYNMKTGASLGMTSAVIPEYQGFWMKAYNTSTTTYDFTLTENYKYDGAGVYQKANEAPLMAKIQFTAPSGTNDEVGTHFWPGAKMGFDHDVDIQKYGVDTTQLNLHITGANGEPIWVNAMPEEAMDYTFDLFVNTSEVGEHTISWTNIGELFGNYSCVRLMDNETKMSYDMLATSSMTFNVSQEYFGTRFTVIARKLVDLSQTATTNPTCNGKDNGSVELSLPKNTGGYFFSVFDKNLGDVVAIAQGDLDKIQINLKAGSYSLINNKSTECGMGSYDFELVDPAPVVAKFAADKTYILPGATVEFENNSTGGINFVWSFSDDMSESYDKHTSHTYPLPGTYNVTLKVSNADPDCYQTKSEQIRVADPNGVTEQDVNGLKLVAVKGGINYVNPFPEKAHLAVHTLDGKLILDQDLVDPNGTVNLKTSGSFVATLSSGSKIITRQLVVF